MALVRTEAFVVQAFRYGETSVILRLLTRDRGVVPVIAKGARRPKSRFGPALEPFHRIEVTYYDKPGREIQTLSQADRVGAHPGIVASLERMQAAGAWLRFLRAVVPEGAPSAELFHLAAAALARLEATPAERTRRWETWHRAAAAELLGLGPSLEACAGCGRPLPDPEGMAFVVEEGGPTCAACAARWPGAPGLAPREYALLALYHHPDYGLVEQLEVVGEKEVRVQELIHRFIDWHADLRPAAAGRR